MLEAAGGRCFYCNGVADRGDHIDPWIHGGTDDELNLAAACRRCNHLKGDHVLTPCPTVAVVGEIGVGKSTLARALAAHTGWPHLAIDDYRARLQTWDDLLQDLDAGAPAIVESVAIPRTYRLRLILRCALIVHVDCPEPERQHRIAGRPVPTDRFLAVAESAYATIDGTAPATPALLDELARAAVRDPRRAAAALSKPVALRLA